MHRHVDNKMLYNVDFFWFVCCPVFSMRIRAHTNLLYTSFLILLLPTAIKKSAQVCHSESAADLHVCK